MIVCLHYIQSTALIFQFSSPKGRICMMCVLLCTSSCQVSTAVQRLHSLMFAWLNGMVVVLQSVMNEDVLWTSIYMLWEHVFVCDALCEVCSLVLIGDACSSCKQFRLPPINQSINQSSIINKSHQDHNTTNTNTQSINQSHSIVKSRNWKPYDKIAPTTTCYSLPGIT